MAGAEYGSWPQQNFKRFQDDPLVGVLYKKTNCKYVLTGAPREEC